MYPSRGRYMVPSFSSCCSSLSASCWVTSRSLVSLSINAAFSTMPVSFSISTIVLSMIWSRSLMLFGLPL